MLWPEPSVKKTDTLRETQISQFYRYAKKTQISLDPKKYRYVGVICTFEIRKYLISPSDIRDELPLFFHSLHTIYKFVGFITNKSQRSGSSIASSL